MAPAFRYRYVDIGTVFTGDSRTRGAQSGDDSPATLFANELACDVGGTCWGANEPLAILDHHPPNEAQFPSASAAVLHKAALIRDRFAPRDDVVWLVTHRQPDFDAFCSMYLARWAIENSDAALDWKRYGLHPDGWLDLPDGRKLDWLNPDLSAVPREHRWPPLLAGYASIVEQRRHISCPRERALRSVLYAALHRGRDYLNATSGATEFFDEIKSALVQRQLNPAFDSVLEGSANFAPELAMLDRETEAYGRDLQRARQAIVYLPESEAPSPDFFEHRRKPSQGPSPANVSAEHLLLADTFRIATDGIYLRDPECALFREWARVDLENSARGTGFEFTAIAYSEGRPGAPINTTEYVFSLDPERANGRHLYTVWSRLQTKEVEAVRAHKLPVSRLAAHAGAGHVTPQRAETLGALLSNPWVGGQIQSSTLVDTPSRGTLIAPPGTRSDLRDDVVAEAVRAELEAPIYSAASMITGPQVTIWDFAASQVHHDVPARSFELSAPLEIPPPEPGNFRFARIGLRADVPISGGGTLDRRLARQTGETLWQVLYPERPGAIPQEFQRHLVVTNSVGVWSDRGLAIAQKPGAEKETGAPAERQELRNFAAIVSLARDTDQLIADWNSLDSATQPSHLAHGSAGDVGSIQETATAGEDLAHRALQLQHVLTLPDQELLRRFCEAIGAEQLAARLRDLNFAVAERLRRILAAEEARRAEKRSAEAARMQSKLEWLELFLVGFIAIEIVDMLTRHVNLPTGLEDALVMLGGPAIVLLAAWTLKPWKRKAGTTEATRRPVWILAFVIVLWLAAWLADVLPRWNK